MYQVIQSVFVIVILLLLVGCGADRENPTAKTESDRLMESYLVNVEKIGHVLAEVHNEAEAEAVTAEVMLIVEDMRTLVPKMKAVEQKVQADTMSKYRVKINKVNEQFVKDITKFVEVPGASEDLIEQLKSMPRIDIDE